MRIHNFNPADILFTFSRIQRQNYMKKRLLIGIFAVTSVPIYAQQNTVATGGNASGSNGSVSFTVGQIDYTTASGTDATLSEGVQQPFEFFDPDAGLSEHQFNISLYPNPSNEFVIVNIADWNSTMNYQLTDAKGSLVQFGTIVNEETILDMRDLSIGSYHLHLSSSNQTIRTLQIIKN